MKTRILLTLLSVFLLVSSVSCGSTSGNTPAATTAAQGAGGTPGETAPAETDPEFIPDTLPAGLDFKGETITGLYRTDVVDSFYVAEQSGDVVNDAVNAANRAVEERLNVKFVVETLDGSSDADRKKYMSAVTNSVQAGDDAWQLIGVLAYNCPMLLQEGVFLDLLSVRYLDLDKPWWTAGLTETATVLGKLYFISGDISLEMTQRLFCMLFNKDLMDDLKLESMYDVVNSGKWTIDRLMEISETATRDANGDGELNEGDVYGFINNDINHTYGFLGSCNMTVTTPDKDGVHHLDFCTEYDVNVFEKVSKLLKETKGVFFNQTSDAGTNSTSPLYRAMFMENKAAIITSEFYQVSSFFREMEAEFGIIPFPKYDEKQEEYYSLARNVYSTFSVPTTCKDPDAVGAFMEALASENYRSTSRVYFETALKVKYARDNESSQMYDIIKDSMFFNFGYTFNGVENNVVNQFSNALKPTSTDTWVTKYASFADSVEARLQDFYKSVRDLGK